jgi:hypothetical protein
VRTAESQWGNLGNKHHRLDAQTCSTCEPNQHIPTAAHPENTSFTPPDNTSDSFPAFNKSRVPHFSPPSREVGICRRTGQRYFEPQK